MPARLLLLVVLTPLLLSCASRARGLSPIGERCSLPGRGDGATQVFVEVAELTRPDDVEVTWSAHMLATPGSPATMAWHGADAAPVGQRCVRADCRLLSVTPATDPARPGQLSLRIVFDGADQQAASHAETTVVVADQQLVMLALQGKPGHVLAVTPYLVHGADDLRQLAACKARARERS